MYSAKQIRQLLLILVGVALGAGSANAQPLQMSFRTIEARVAQADHVVVGTIDKVSRKTTVEPGVTDKMGVSYPEGQFEYTVTLKIGEVLKGDLKGIVDDLSTIEITRHSDKRYEEWSQAQTTMLWFLGPTPKRGARRDWEILPLGQRVPSERPFDSTSMRGGRWRYSMDFSLLKNDEELLARARAYGKTSQKVQRTHSIKIPPGFSPESSGGGDFLIVPVEPTLEERSKRLIVSPQDFAPKGVTLDASGYDLLRLGGVNSLRYFKSDANAVLLRKVFESGDDSLQSIRTKAYEVLLHWDVDVPLTESAQTIVSLDLAGTDVTDQRLKQWAQLKNLTTINLQATKVTDVGLKYLAQLKNLESLDLQYTNVTAAGLKELAGLKKLWFLGLSENQMNDATLRVLREIGLLHQLCHSGTARNERPKSVEEVVYLSLCRSPVSDEGIRELRAFKNLAWLDLRETHVTDAGLKELAGLKNLASLFLNNTQVTEAGVAELQKALPKCDIKRSASSLPAP